MKCPLQNNATVNSSVAAYAASYNNVESIRGCCLDELPQVLDLISGDMSFVGTRPEAVKYVEKYKPEYYDTLLLPAGITSLYRRCASREDEVQPGEH